MQTQINIASIGFNIGTIGWLKLGLTSGTIILEEGTLKGNGNHGLWLKYGGNSQFLAARNKYGLDPRQPFARGVYLGYAPAGPEDRSGMWTAAAWAALMSIASQWCDEMNAARASDSDETFNPVIRRVEIKKENGLENSTADSSKTA